MKINQTSPIGMIEQYKSIRRNEAPAIPEVKQQRDEIEFSSDAALFADTLKSVKTSIEVRMEEAHINIESIKSEIASGAYVVDEEVLAASIFFAVHDKE